jgi:hypothetical protein
MQTVFVLQHLHVLPGDDEDYKFIGVYRTHESAARAVGRLQQQPGFRDFPDLVADLGKGRGGSGFYLDEYRLDEDGWTSGFETVETSNV